jgi:hypothetical protein
VDEVRSADLSVLRSWSEALSAKTNARPKNDGGAATTERVVSKNWKARLKQQKVT